MASSQGHVIDVLFYALKYSAGNPSHSRPNGFSQLLQCEPRAWAEPFEALVLDPSH